MIVKQVTLKTKIDLQKTRNGAIFLSIGWVDFSNLLGWGAWAVYEKFAFVKAESLSIVCMGLITERIEGTRHQCSVEKLMLTNAHIKPTKCWFH